MSRVILLEDTDYDIRDAYRFGKPVVMFTQRPSVFDHVQFAPAFKKRIRDLQFNKRADHFLMIGTAAPLILSTSFLIEEYETFSALLYHAGSQRYVERILGFANLLPQGDNTRARA